MGITRKNDYDYFAFFCVSAAHARKAAEYLHSSLQCFDSSRFETLVEEMHDIEHAADVDKHDMMKHLHREFLPPIEREDIVSLAQQLDDVTDAIEDVMRRVYMFDIRELRAGVLDFTELLIQCCKALEEAVREFRNFKTSKTIHDRLVAVNTLESAGDKLHAENMRRLFQENASARTTLTWMTLYDGLENCLDACEDAADIIEGVIMKNS
jgi:predicted phosphate transport protein (TIGR00153 family)